MRKALAVLSVLGAAAAANAQSPWDSGPVSWAFIDSSTQNYNFSPTVAGNTVTRIDIYMNPQHTWRSDMGITITAPNATSAIIYNHEDGSSDFISCFFQAGGTSLASGDLNSAVSGIMYAPSNPLSSINATTGTWTISCNDNAGGDQGTIVRMVLYTVPAPGSLALLGMGGLLAARRRR